MEMLETKAMDAPEIIAWNEAFEGSKFAVVIMRKCADMSRGEGSNF